MAHAASGVFDFPNYADPDVTAALFQIFIGAYFDFCRPRLAETASELRESVLAGAAFDATRAAMRSPEGIGHAARVMIADPLTMEELQDAAAKPWAEPARVKARIRLEHIMSTLGRHTGLDREDVVAFLADAFVEHALFEKLLADGRLDTLRYMVGWFKGARDFDMDEFANRQPSLRFGQRSLNKAFHNSDLARRAANLYLLGVDVMDPNFDPLSLLKSGPGPVEDDEQ